MYPELFTIPGLNWPVHSFGLMMVIGLLLAMELGKRLARSRGIDSELFVNAGILALISGLIGARLSHVLENFSAYTDPTRSAWENFRAAVNITSGGLTYYGGFLLAFPVLVLYARKTKIPLRTGMDIVAPCLMIGLALGRVGCFLNGCCYGAPTDLPWSVRFPYGSIAWTDQYNAGQIKLPEALQTSTPLDPGSPLTYTTPLPPDKAFKNPLTRDAALACSAEPLHPAQLYSTFTALLIAAVCAAYFTTPHAPGRGMALMMILEGTARFLLESVRAEPSVLTYTLAGRPYGLSYSMVLGLAIIAMGMILWATLGHLASRPERGSPLHPPATPA